MGLPAGEELEERVDECLDPKWKEFPLYKSDPKKWRRDRRYSRNLAHAMDFLHYALDGLQGDNSVEIERLHGPTGWRVTFRTTYEGVYYEGMAEGDSRSESASLAICRAFVRMFDDE